MSIDHIPWSPNEYRALFGTGFCEAGGGEIARFKGATRVCLGGYI